MKYIASYHRAPERMFGINGSRLASAILFFLLTQFYPPDGQLIQETPKAFFDHKPLKFSYFIEILVFLTVCMRFTQESVCLLVSPLSWEYNLITRLSVPLELFEPILYLIFISPIHLFGDFTPPLPECFLHLEYQFVFPFSPGPSIQVGIQMVVVSLTALLSITDRPSALEAII